MMVTREICLNSPSIFSSSPMDACLVCGASASNKCSGCGVARYCSVAHQRKDWPTHKIDCKTLRRGIRHPTDDTEFDAGTAILGSDFVMKKSQALLPRTLPLQALVELTERSMNCVPTTEADFLVFIQLLNSSMEVAATVGPYYALASYARSALFRHIMSVAMLPSRPAPTAAGYIALTMPLMLLRVDSCASVFAETAALQLCVRVCTRALDSENSGAGLYALWQLGPVAEAIDLVALELLPRIVAFAGVADVGRPSSLNKIWSSRHQARAILKDLMVARSLEHVTILALQSQFASRPRFRTAVDEVARAGGLGVFCDALLVGDRVEGDEDVDSALPVPMPWAKTRLIEADSIVLLSLMAFAACENPAWLARIQSAAAASGWSARARTLFEQLGLPVPGTGCHHRG